ncbi:molybdopterin-dependent oxidoreductase [Labedella endophytica]|uniref:Oxidoreductase n=1 Tax=Labedella endophytica TaxID=1523160 RepID=A0A3S0VAS1_9MICO|nr:molybdopterin-dependent oxidoreductase [Labedella endophytica]RUR00936.1 oxidoreductase [Labedella endophytica]
MSTRTPESAASTSPAARDPRGPGRPAPPRPHPAVAAGAVGVVSAIATLAIAELVALVVAPAASPLLAVGSLVIDLVPGWVKDLVIALFGTNDKVVLLLCLAVLVAALAFLSGLLEWRRPPWGTVVLGIVGVIAVIAATTRAGATGMWASPTVAGVIVGVLVLRFGSERLSAWIGVGSSGRQVDSRTAISPDPSLADTAVSRRRFLVFTGATAVGALLVGVGARVANAAAAAADTARRALRLPTAATPAAPVPAGADLGIDGLSPVVTPNGEFYRIDTALQVPGVDPATWSLRVFGEVEEEFELSWDELLALPMQESTVTLACVSNEVGGDLIGNALWLGYPLRELLARAKPREGADMVLSRSIDGFTAGTPLSVLQEEDRDSLIAIGMNGEPLPVEHGFPARLVVPGLYGYVSATKWVVSLEVTRFSAASAYWTDRGWSAEGPVKTQSRIDVPTNRARVSAGTVAVAGVAWAQHTGIDRVEVRVDGGDWTEARLATAISADTWVQWVYEWDATAGDHTLQVRATDNAGTTQGEREVPVVPDGAEGWHTIDVSVS